MPQNRDVSGEDLPQRRSRLGCGAVIVLLVLIVAGFGAWIFHRLETWPSRTAEQVSRVFAEVAHLQPKVTVEDRVYFEQTASVLELAVVTRETQVEREVLHEWLGSKKRIKLRGVYQVRAGFDLTQPFTVKVEGRSVLTKLPPPKILSVDQVDIEILAYQNGLWNKIQPKDLEAELRTLPMLARQKAGEAGLQAEALKLFSEQLRQKFSPDYELQVEVPKRLD